MLSCFLSSCKFNKQFQWTDFYQQAWNSENNFHDCALETVWINELSETDRVCASDVPEYVSFISRFVLQIVRAFGFFALVLRPAIQLITWATVQMQRLQFIRRKSVTWMRAALVAVI